eukprot:Platyproteum_vivax@DN1256_c0_g1_i1.p1
MDLVNWWPSCLWCDDKNANSSTLVSDPCWAVFFDDKWRTKFLQYFADAVVKMNKENAFENGVSAVISSNGITDKSLITPPEDCILMTDETLDHSWLLPLCQGCVVHGGAGSTQQCLISGCPTAVVPFGAASDQPFWGQLVADKKLGPYPVKATKISSVAAARRLLHSLLSNQEFQSNAQKMRTEMLKDSPINSIIKIVDEVSTNPPAG